MEKKKGFGDKLEAFFAGKGFYIVLFLCIAVIGVSAWAMLDGTGANVENNQAEDLANVPSIPDGSFVEPIEPDLGESHQDEETIIEDPAENEEVMEIEPEPVINEDTLTDEPVMAQAETMYIWPLAGEIEVPYSVTALVYNKTMADWRIHDGIDITAGLGTQVMVAASGVVERIFNDDMYGMTVVINHGGGIKSYYANLAETPTVYEGDSVTAGEIIGSVGDTALCEAGDVVHLHFSMTLDGQSVDPLEYLPER